MSVLIQFTTQPESFVLSGAAANDLRVELERIVTFDGPQSSFAWVPTADTAAFEQAASSDDAITAVSQLEDGDRSFYRIDWPDERPALVEAIAGADGIVLSCALDEGGWRFKVRFPDSSAAQAFQERQAAASFNVNVTKVLSVTDESEETPLGLTTKQYLALRAAYQLGHFERPREVTVQELANRFDVSAQSMSALLRRGMKNLLEEAIPLQALESDELSVAGESLAPDQ